MTMLQVARHESPHPLGQVLPKRDAFNAVPQILGAVGPGIGCYGAFSGFAGVTGQGCSGSGKSLLPS